MLNITQNSTATWLLYIENSLPSFLFEATEKCSGLIKLFNATNLAPANCDFIEFLVREVTAGVEDLDNADVIFIAGEWTVKIYEQISATNKDPSLATFIKQQELKVKSDGTVILTPPIPTPGFCANGTITNSDASFNDTVTSGGNLILPDITHTDSDLSSVILPAQTAMVCTPAGPTPSGVAYCRPALTGQTISYNARDDGDRQQTGEYDFSADGQTPATVQRLDPASRLLLEFNNTFGNKTRFTNDMGGTVTNGSDGSTADYTVDNYTGYGWKISINVGVWTVALADNVFGSFTDMFIPNYNEIAMMADLENTDPMNYAPFNSTANVPFPTGTTAFNSTTVNYSLDNNTGRMTTTAKTTFYVYFRTRKHF